jgi:UDP-glucose/galactose:(glucosyl)LPS alpha-1,2-glucosyl/galactosyltransferase
MNLLYCIDKNYNEQCYTAIKSHVSNAMSPLRIYVIHQEPHTFSKELVESFSENKIELLEVIKFQENLIRDDTKLKKDIKNSHVSMATYFRLFIDKHLPTDLTQIVYVDPDVICIKNFEMEYSEIFKLMKEDKYVIGSKTIGDEKGNEELYQRLGLKKRKYFNAGVMFIDLQLWRQQNIEINLQKLLYKNTYKFHDQDILNQYFDGNHFELHKHMNYLIRSQDDGYEKEVIKYVEESAKLIHYIGATKPWHIDSVNSKYSSYYQNYYSQLGLKTKHVIKQPRKRDKKILVKFKDKLSSLFNRT